MDGQLRLVKLGGIKPKMTGGWKTIVTVVHREPELGHGLTGKSRFKLLVADDENETSLLTFGGPADVAYAQYELNLTLEICNPLVVARQPKYNVLHSPTELTYNMRGGKIRVLHGHQLLFPLPTLRYNPVALNQVQYHIDRAVDLIVTVVKEKGGPLDGQRTIVVRDGTALCEVKLWDAMGANFSMPTLNTIVALKDFRITLWENEPSVIASKSSVIVFSPVHPTARALSDLLVVEPDASMLPKVDDKQATLRLATRCDIGGCAAVVMKRPEMSHFFAITGRVGDLSPAGHNIMFPSCSLCNKKLPDGVDCPEQSCVDKLAQRKWNGRVTLELGDKSGYIAVTVWFDQICELLNTTPKLMSDLREADRDAAEKCLLTMLGQDVLMSIKGKTEIYEGDEIVKFTALAIVTQFDDLGSATPPAVETPLAPSIKSPIVTIALPSPLTPPASQQSIAGTSFSQEKTVDVETLTPETSQHITRLDESLEQSPPALRRQLTMRRSPTPTTTKHRARRHVDKPINFGPVDATAKSAPIKKAKKNQ